MQKCSGYRCLHRDRCLRYTKRSEKTKGSWVNADYCINADEPYNKLILEKVMLTEDQQAQVDRLVSNAKAMKPKDLDDFIENVQQSEDEALRDAVLDGIATFQTAREEAKVVVSELNQDDAC